MNNDNGNKKTGTKKTSTEASIKNGKQAIKMNKKTSGINENKKDGAEKKDAEQWRNEG